MSVDQRQSHAECVVIAIQRRIHMEEIAIVLPVVTYHPHAVKHKLALAIAAKRYHRGPVLRMTMATKRVPAVGTTNGDGMSETPKSVMVDHWS